MKVYLILLLSAGAAVYFPWIYLLGALSAYIPTYMYLFKKATRKIKEIDENNLLLMEQVPEDIDKTGYYTRSIMIHGIWVILCFSMWWFLLLVSTNTRSTNTFIEGFVAGATKSEY